MKLSRISKTLIASALVAGLGAGFAFASADDQVKARQDEMKAFGKAIGEMVKIVKGEAPYDAAVVKAQLDAMAAAEKAAGEAKAWDPSGAQGETVKSYAKPEAFTDGPGIEAAYKAFVEARMALAATTDEAGFKAAFPALGGSCKGCHDKFRLPKE